MSANDKNGDRVSVDREEYDALMVAKDAYDDARVTHAKDTNRNHDLVMTCRAQAERLAEVDLIIRHQDRVVGLQGVLVDMLREGRGSSKVAGLESLSEFWRLWTAEVDSRARTPAQREEVAQFEPDLFRTWKLWVAKASSSFSVAGTRAEVSARATTSTQAKLQEDIVAQLRLKNAQLVAQNNQLEAEIEAHKKSKGR